QLSALEQAMAAGAHDEATLNRYAEAQARLEHAGGYGWRERALATLHGLGFRDDADLDRSLRSFSGGELTRASLARALAGDPDVLLLDEPTNHVVAQAQVALARGTLVVQRHAGVARPRELAAVGRLLARQHAQQRRLPGAVAAGDRQALATLQAQRDPREQRAAGHVLGQVGGGENCHGAMLDSAVSNAPPAPHALARRPDAGAVGAGGAGRQAGQRRGPVGGDQRQGG